MSTEQLARPLKDWMTQSSTWTLRLDYLLMWVAAWSYLIVGVHPLYRGKKFLLLVIGLILAARWLYRKEGIQFRIQRWEWFFYTCVVGANLLLHGPDMTSDIAGDEAYHAKRAGIVLLELRYQWYQWPPLALQEYRSDYWKWFDFRHLPVVEVWRWVSMPILVFVVAGLALQRRMRALPEAAKWALLLVGCLIAAWYQHQSIHVPDHHSPFRLFPIFSSTVLFGYNEFALRLPGILVVSLVSWALFRAMRQSDDGPIILVGKAVFAFLVGAMPSVYYAAHGVEASIYGMLVIFLVLWFGRRYLVRRDFKDLMLCGVLTGAGVLTRQSIFGLWPVVGLFFLFDRQNFHWKRILLVFFPFLLNVGYIYVLLSGDHGAVSKESSALELIIQAFSSGGAFSTAISSNSPAWLLFTGILLLSIFLGRQHTWRDALPFVAVVPLYALFFGVVPSVMGVARYQAEYIGPFMALIFLYAGERMTTRRAGWTLSAAVYLMVVTLEFRMTAPQDIRFVNPGQLQGSAAVHFPFRATLSELRRAEALGAFALVGGQGQYGEVPLWLSGHSFTESINCLEKSRQVKKQIGRDQNWPANLAFLRERGIRYLVLQEGTRRERLNRSPQIQKFYQQVYAADGQTLRKIRSNVGRHGGVLEVYQVLLDP